MNTPRGRARRRKLVLYLYTFYIIIIYVLHSRIYRLIYYTMYTECVLHEVGENYTCIVVFVINAPVTYGIMTEICILTHIHEYNMLKSSRCTYIHIYLAMYILRKIMYVDEQSEERNFEICGTFCGKTSVATTAPVDIVSHHQPFEQPIITIFAYFCGV